MSLNYDVTLSGHKINESDNFVFIYIVIRVFINPHFFSNVLLTYIKISFLCTKYFFSSYHFILHHFCITVFLLKMVSKTRRWCFTLKNFCNSDISTLEKLKDCDVSSIIVSKEFQKYGPDRLRGFIKFKRSKKICDLQKTVLENAQWEKPTATDFQIMNYCSESLVLIKKGKFKNKEKKGRCPSVKTVSDCISKDYNKMTLDEKNACITHEKTIKKKIKRYCRKIRCIKQYLLIFMLSLRILNYILKKL